MAAGHPASKCYLSHIRSVDPALGSKFTARLVQRPVGLWVTGRGQTADSDWWAVGLGTSLPGWEDLVKYRYRC